MDIPGLLRDAASLASARSDRSGYVPDSLPEGVVRSRSVAEVQEVLRYASAHRIPVVTRGAGSGLAGGASARSGEIVLDVSLMDQILELDPLEQIARVQPGVMNSAVSDAARPHGLFYAPDPASMTYCSIGGNIATNAGGMRCAKYGVTRESVLGLKVVLASGEVISTGGKTIKRVSGYDLTALMVGSEGTLGVVVEATLRLRPLPVQTSTLVGYFPGFIEAAACASAIVTSGVQPTILELMDGKTLGAVDEATGSDHSAHGGALLLVQTDGLGATREMAAIEAVVAGHTKTYRTTDDQDESESLLHSRREAIPSIERRGVAYVGDVGVPRIHLAQMAQRLSEIGEETGVDLYVIAHAGDGNLHPILVIPEGQSVMEGPPKEALDQMFWAAKDFGGTLTGEHGIGVLKRSWLEPELGEGVMELQRQIKAVFDPQGILNPGKAI